ncbi:hypothetical protein ONZ43_g6682 [Nemania bipapillata]|uniref:Uncharacterized protein n=1 Tax=Nemania bipapillata TaxID=110536 RepID=A0ACC2HXV5_9PEZI|nr:hypothetical protein ONZ43_g6682 [Nemania bipapillata]
MGMGDQGSLNTANNAQNLEALPKIQQALDVVYNPYSSNDDRKAAQSFLESIKDTPEAPTHGFRLASDKNQSPVVRHYALSLLEHAIKHKWASYSPHEAEALRNWVLQMSRDVAKGDPVYLRNKIAQLWVEVAKRSWGTEWMDMDSLLVQLWQVPDSAVHKEFVLAVLETLSDEIFNGDDMVVQIREKVLSKASVEIFTPAAVLLEAFPDREAGPECLSGDVQNNEDLRSCAVHGFGVLYALMPWVIPKSVAMTGAVPVICQGLRASHIEVQKASLEALHALYSRTSFDEVEFLELVVPLYSGQYVTLFRQLFEWSVIDLEDIDDDKYQLCKKFSEVIENIVLLKVSDAMQHILGQTEDVLTHLYDDSQPLDMANYSKVSQPVLRVDARATVIEAALKGYSKWRAGVKRDDKQEAQEVGALSSSLEGWCNRLLEMKFEDVYDQIAAKVDEMVASGTLDEKRQITYQTFLFTIIHRSRRLDQTTKIQKLQGFLDPIRAQWQDPRLKQSLSSHANFCELMGLDKAQEYVMRRRMHEIQDWGSVELDEEGKALQIELEARQTSLPLRLTKSFLTCSVDKVDKNQEPFQLSSILWQDCFPIILPELLNFLSYAHASHSSNNWTGLPPDMRSIVDRILTDRFWQSGISEGSKDDFYARVLEKKLTFEGLASTIRGSIRYVRESCYAIIYSNSQGH